MGAKLEKIENSEAYLSIEVDARTMEEGMQKAYKKVVKQVNIPGFRKGRAPREILEAYYGKEILFEDALEAVVPDAYQQAIEDLDIDPLAAPEFDIQGVEAGQNFTFTAKVAVKPEVKLGQMEGLEVALPSFTVSEEDIDDRMEEMRARYAEVIEKTDEPSQVGDTVTIDFQGFVEGSEFAGGTAEDYQLELGSQTFIPGFEEQLVGLKTGESKDVQVTFPENYHEQSLAAKNAVFKVQVKKIEGKKLRELDDDFAQEVSSYNTLEELRESVRDTLTGFNEYQKKKLFKEKIIDQIVEKCELVIAPGVVELQLDKMLRQLEAEMNSQGMQLEHYFRFTGSTLEQFREKMRPEAEKNVKSNFILDKLAEEKGLAVSDEEIEKYLEGIAEENDVTVEEVKQKLAASMESITFNLRIAKSMDYLMEKAIVTEEGSTQEIPHEEGKLED